MLVNPAALIAAAISSASALVLTAVNDIVFAASRASVVFSDSLMVNVLVPEDPSVPTLIMLLVILVAAATAVFLRHSLNVAVVGVVSKPDVSLALACVNNAFSGIPAPPPLRSK